MKNLFFLLFITLSACSEELDLDISIENEIDKSNYAYANVSGYIKDGHGTQIRIESPQMNGTIKFDNAVIDEDDKFNIDLSIPEDFGYYNLRLLNNSKDSIGIPLKGGDSIILNTSLDEFNIKPGLKGVSWSKEANEFLKQKNEANSDKNKIAKIASNLMRENPASPYNIILSQYFIGSESDINSENLDILENVTKAFNESFPLSLASKNFSLASKNLKQQVDYFNSLPKLKEGDPVSNISLNSPKNKTLNLSDLKGKYVLVDFWASWCGPCRRENPNVVKLYKKYRKKNFTVYSVSLDQDGTKWKQAIKMDNLIWPNHVSDLKGWNSTVVSTFGIQSIPYTILVNPEGKIIGVNLRGKELEDKLEQIFKS